MGRRKNKSERKAIPSQTEAQPWWRNWVREDLAWGLAILILLRPWRDGLTFKTDNFYYLWFLALLFALYLARVFLRGQTIRFGDHLLLAAAFPLVALVLAPATIHVDSTYRSLLLWGGHIALFMMVADGLRTPLGFRIVLGAFLVASFIEAFWSLLHYQYVLPALRRLINESPAVLGQYFGTNELTPVLRHRLESNRAFGRFLFPNALAAFLLVAIPYAACSVVTAAQDFRRALRDAPEVDTAPETSRLYEAGLIGLLAWLIVFVASALLYPFLLQQWTGDADWLGRPLLSIFFVGVVPLAVAAAPYAVARRYGPRVAGLGVCAIFFPALLFCQLLSLYLTFSRGGILALVVSAALGAAFLAFAWRGRLRRFRVALTSVILAGIVVGLAYGTASFAQAPSSAMPDTSITAPPGNDLNIEGRDLTGADIVNPASFYLRITYWKVALSIARDYWLTGVGLGNFSTIYPVYQYLGAGDVQAAHNDYLQFLCETGVAGLAAFLAFWIYLLVQGARRVLGVPDRREQLLMTAMLAGVLAFMIHAIVDFPFVNPSLAFFEYLLGGLVLARVGLHMPVVNNRNLHRIVAGLLLVVTAFGVGASVRVYVSDYVMGGRALLNVGNPRTMGQRAQASAFLLAAPQSGPTPSSKDPFIEIGTAYSLIPSLDVLQSFGVVRVPADPRGLSFRAPTPNEAVPPFSRFYITDAAMARAEGFKYSELWLQDLRDLDALYPHNSELALYIVGMNLEMIKHSSEYEAQMRYALDALTWAENAIARNPMQSVAWQYYALALTQRANLERTEKALDYYDQMLAAFKKAAELYPTGALHWRQYGDALRQIGPLVGATDPQRAQVLLSESEAAHSRAAEIERVRHELGM